jgi:hypothetical protein
MSFVVMAFGRRRITKNAEHSGAGVRKPPKNETAGEGTNSPAPFGVSARTGGRFFVQPERYGTKIAKWGKVTSPTL